MPCRHPVKSAFHFLFRCIPATPGLRIIGAIDLFDYSSCFILFKTFTFYDVCPLETHFHSRGETEKLVRRNLHKIILFDIYFSAERHQSLTHIFVLGIIDELNILNLAFRIVLYNDFQRTQNTKTPGGSYLQILADRMRQERVIIYGFYLCITNEIDEP